MRTCHYNLHTAAMLLACIAFSQSAVDAAIISTFDSDADGWAHAAGGDADSTVTWSATGGNPGGHLIMTDMSQGHEDYFVAPAKFLGNDLAAYGRQLAFDIEDDHAADSFPDAVVIAGDGFIITHSIRPLSVNALEHISLTLDEAGGWQFDGGGVPNALQFQSILSDISALQIAGDYTNTVESVSLDNVTLPVPEPSSSLLLLMGTLAWLLQLRRRIHRGNSR